MIPEDTIVVGDAVQSSANVAGKPRPVAVVTGGHRGIGLACAAALAESGFDLVVADVAAAPGKELSDCADANHINFVYVRCDISKLDDHAKVVETALALGRIDCLVNNAGIASPVRGDLLDLKPENFDRVIDVNLRGTIFLTHAVARAMLASSGEVPKTIVNITSVSAEMASPERADYCISKAGLSMWSKNLALRLADTGIAVFEVRPGIIRSEMTTGVTAKYDALIADGVIPARRWGEGADVGVMVAALAGGRLGFATGSTINVDGALSIPRL